MRRSRRRSSTVSRTTSSAVGSTPLRISPRPSSTSTASRRQGLTPSARCESVARPERAISSRSSSPCSEAACGFEAGWRSQARCSTARSQPRGSSDNPQGLAWNLFNRSYAAFAAGDIDLALATAKEAFELAQELDHGPVPAHAAVALAYARFETGHPERCAELLVEFAGGNELRLIGGGWRARYLELLTRSLLAAGRRDEAEHAAAAAQACAEAVGLPMAGAMAALAAAALDLDGGEPAAAAERALSAAAALEEVGNVFDAATSRLLAGRALAAGGRARPGGGRARARSRGVRVLRLAPLPTAGRTGAPEARTLDPPAHAPGQGRRVGVDSLTERELQIARLVVDRKTNPQIAAELFLSSKTVETHLRNTFRKLGVASRVEVARAVERADHTP